MYYGPPLPLLELMECILYSLTSFPHYDPSVPWVLDWIPVTRIRTGFVDFTFVLFVQERAAARGNEVRLLPYELHELDKVLAGQTVPLYSFHVLGEHVHHVVAATLAAPMALKEVVELADGFGVVLHR